MIEDFEYSYNAKLTIPQFDYDSKTIRIYVEGKDDIPFWNEVVNSIVPQNYNVIMEELGGSSELYKLLDNVQDSQNFIVFLDSEYDDILCDKEKYKNKLTVFTKRHSIENYMFCRNSILRIINIHNRNLENYNEEINNYISKLCCLLEPLLYLDCLKIKGSKHIPKNISILGSQHSVAKLSSNGIYPKREKIKSFIVKLNLHEVDISAIRSLFKGKNIYNYINGHFISYSVCKFISSKIPHNIQTSQLYNYTYGNCELCKNKCLDFKNLQKRIQQVIKNYLALDT